MKTESQIRGKINLYRLQIIEIEKYDAKDTFITEEIKEEEAWELKGLIEELEWVLGVKKIK